MILPPPLLLVVVVAVSAVIVASKQQTQQNQIMTTPLRQVVACKCGQIKLKIDSPSALRIVCYSKDYRGYYQTLNAQAKLKNQPPHATLDDWGG